MSSNNNGTPKDVSSDLDDALEGVSKTAQDSFRRAIHFLAINEIYHAFIAANSSPENDGDCERLSNLINEELDRTAAYYLTSIKDSLKTAIRDALRRYNGEKILQVGYPVEPSKGTSNDN